jgi:hypothetical protein
MPEIRYNIYGRFAIGYFQKNNLMYKVSIDTFGHRLVKEILSHKDGVFTQVVVDVKSVNNGYFCKEILENIFHKDCIKDFVKENWNNI